MKTVSCLLHVPVTLQILISFDLFNTVFCLNFLGHLFIASPIFSLLLIFHSPENNLNNEKFKSSAHYDYVLCI